MNKKKKLIDLKNNGLVPAESLQDHEKIIPAIHNLKPLHFLFLETMYHLNVVSIKRMQFKAEDKKLPLEYTNEERKLITRAKKILAKEKYIRLVVAEIYNRDQAQREAMDAASRDNILYWIELFGWTFDPRLTPLGIDAEIPMILWPAQAKLIEKIDECYTSGENLLIEKSRAWGATDLSCFFAMHKFLFDRGFQCGFGSQKADKVDSRNDPDAIFPRLRRILYSMPREMKPEYFRSQKNDYDTEMKLIHPDNNCVIKGDAGDAIGTGGRSSIYFIDEKALIEHPQLVDTAISYNTRCQVDISTPRGLNDFYRKRQSGRVNVFSCWWYQDPAKNLDWKNGKRPITSAWYDLQKLSYDDVIIAQEVDINYQASIESAFIKPEWIEAATNFEINQGAESIAGFDVASGGSNKSVYIHRNGPVVDSIKVYKYDMVVQALWKAVDQGKEDNITLFNYDHAGIGESIESNLVAADIQIPFHFNGIYGQTAAPTDFMAEFGRNGNEIFRNMRGYLWYQLSQRFRKTYEHVKGIRLYKESELISIPDDLTLKSQLATVRKIYTSSGKIGAQSKDEMRKEGIDSPDHADALVYCFAEGGSDTMASSFNYASGKHYSDTKVEFDTSSPGDGYVTLVQDESLALSILCCFWTRAQVPKLIVAEELLVNDPNPLELINDIKTIMHADIYGIRAWLANTEMLPKENSPAQTPWYMFRKAGVTLQANYTNDPRGSIMMLNRMFENNAITINTRCVNLMSQLKNWHTRKGEPDKNLGLAWALSNLVGLLRKREPVKTERYTIEYGKRILQPAG